MLSSRKEEFHDAGARLVNELVIHCSASPNGNSLFSGTVGDSTFRTPADAIDGWHAARGFHRDDAWCKHFNPQLPAIGYHFIIYTNGAIATGRHMDEIGAHVRGNNRSSIGICMIGTDQFTIEQWKSLRGLVLELQKKYARAKTLATLGHRDLSPDRDNDGIVEPWEWLKTCPGFDVRAWLANDMQPDPARVLDQMEVA